MNAKLSWLLVLGVLVVSASEVKAQAYTFTDLGTGTAAAINNVGQVAGTDNQTAILWNGTAKTTVGEGPYFVTSAAHGINDAGHVVGETIDARHDFRKPTLWSDGSETALRWYNLPGLETSALAINNSGQVAGFAEFGGPQAAFWDGHGAEGKLLNTLPGGNESQALAINNAGVVAGWSATTGGAAHATVWRDGQGTDLGVLHGGRESQALAINDAGVVAGWSDNRSIGGPAHATLWDGGRANDLGVLSGGFESKALGINDAGLVVGWSSSFPEGQHAVLWNGTTTIDLNGFLDADKASAGWYLRSANDINERGWIVGDAHNNLTRENHAFLLVPEPETYVMLLAGLGLLAFMVRRKQGISS